MRIIHLYIYASQAKKAKILLLLYTTFYEAIFDIIKSDFWRLPIPDQEGDNDLKLNLFANNNDNVIEIETSTKKRVMSSKSLLIILSIKKSILTSLNFFLLLKKLFLKN